MHTEVAHVPFLVYDETPEEILGACASLGREFQLSQIPIPNLDGMLNDTITLSQTIQDLWEVNELALAQIEKTFDKFNLVLEGCENLQTQRYRVQTLKGLLETGRPCGEWRLHEIKLNSNDRIALNWMKIQMLWANFNLLVDLTHRLALNLYVELDNQFPGMFTNIVEDLQFLGEYDG